MSSYSNRKPHIYLLQRRIALSLTKDFQTLTILSLEFTVIVNLLRKIIMLLIV